MATRKQYDGNLQMFVEEAGQPDMARLRFLRWLGERGWLEHEVAGVPCGDLAISATLGTDDRSSKAA
jgi:hypothetical protein